MEVTVRFKFRSVTLNNSDGSDWTGGWVGRRLSLDDTSFPAREHEPFDPKWTAVKTPQWPRNVSECHVNRAEWSTSLLSGRRLSGHWVLWNISGETLWRLRDGHCVRAAGTLPCGTATGLTHSHMRTFVLTAAVFKLNASRVCVMLKDSSYWFRPGLRRRRYTCTAKPLERVWLEH